MAPSSSSSSDCDESLANDLNALRQALTLTCADTDTNAVSDAPSVSDSDSDSADEDIDLLRDLQSRFSSASAGDSYPLSRTLDSDDESDEDLATLRAIQRRFSQYEASQGREGDEEGSLDSSNLGFQSRFPKSAECFVEALKKNRACQRFIRERLIEIEARIEENKDLKERVKCLMEFQVDSRRRTRRILGQQKDARARLVSMRKTTVSMSKKKSSIKFPVLCSGPPENSCVADYKLILRRFPSSANRQAWSNAEREKLAKGIKQQYQELMLLNSMSLDSDLDGSAYSKLMCALSSKNIEVTPEKIRSFLPLVNWDRLASMYLTGRSGAECEARWLNHEDPLINRNPWTILEDKKLLFIVQERGLINWIDIAITLGTQRTPFQCLARYQRSLNPHILKKDWTAEEDAKLRAAVENFGDNWQMVSSSLEGRTGPQCSNRWRKSILPDRRVGRWSIDEDKRLKVAVMLFGAKNWNKIARFAPGRTQVQCRERWLNCLDPSLNLEAWTAEEDAKLLDAINTHGYCWSKVATCVPPRTDSQCRRRWKVLLPHEVPLLQEALQIKRTALVSNFVDRESERPSIGPDDFCPSVNRPVPGKERSGKTRTKRPRERTKSKKQMEANSNNLSEWARPKSKKPDQNIIADDMINSSEDNALAILPLVPLSKDLNTSEMRRIKRPRNKTSSDILPKKPRAKSGSHHENFVAIDNIADNVPTDLSHVHVKDPNTAESSLTERIRNKSSRDTQTKKARTKPGRSSVGDSSAGDSVMSIETAAADSSAVSGVTSNGAASCGHERKRKTVSRPSDGSRAKVLESASCDVA